MATRVRADRLPFETGIETREIYPTSQLLTALTGESVQANKAIVGRNAFAHEAGIHQDGMLKDRRTYEIMRPEEVGVPAGDAGARQALGPPRRAAPLRAARHRASTATSSIASTRRSSSWPTARRWSATTTSPRSSSGCAPATRRTPCRCTPRRTSPAPRRDRLRARGVAAAGLGTRDPDVARLDSTRAVRSSSLTASPEPDAPGPESRASYSTVTLFARFLG